MTFESWKREMIHHNEHLEALRKAGERAYVIRVGDSDRGSVILGRQSEIAAFVDARTDGTMYLRLRHIQWGMLDNLGDLTADELGRVVIIRELMQAWIDGKLPEMPATMPWE